jgi:hypothetical protein
VPQRLAPPAHWQALPAAAAAAAGGGDGDGDVATDSSASTAASCTVPATCCLLAGHCIMQSGPYQPHHHLPRTTLLAWHPGAAACCGGQQPQSAPCGNQGLEGSKRQHHTSAGAAGVVMRAEGHDQSHRVAGSCPGLCSYCCCTGCGGGHASAYADDAEHLLPATGGQTGLLTGSRCLPRCFVLRSRMPCHF